MFFSRGHSGQEGLLTSLPCLNFPRLTGGYFPPTHILQEEGPGTGRPLPSFWGPWTSPSQFCKVCQSRPPSTGPFCCPVGQGSYLLCIGWHHLWQCPLQGLHHVEGCLAAAYNLVHRSITNLCVIGRDSSVRGGEVFLS